MIPSTEATPLGIGTKNPDSPNDTEQTRAQMQTQTQTQTQTQKDRGMGPGRTRKLGRFRRAPTGNNAIAQDATAHNQQQQPKKNHRLLSFRGNISNKTSKNGSPDNGSPIQGATTIRTAILTAYDNSEEPTARSGHGIEMILPRPENTNNDDHDYCDHENTTTAKSVPSVSSGSGILSKGDDNSESNGPLYFCGGGERFFDNCGFEEEEYNDSNNINNNTIQQKIALSLDPTVQESIECIFAHQLQEQGWQPRPEQHHHHHQYNLLSNDPTANNDNNHHAESAAEVHKKISANPSTVTATMTATSTTTKRRATKSSSRLIHVATYDPTLDQREPPAIRKMPPPRRASDLPLPSSFVPSKEKAYCHCRSHQTPIASPHQWPQRPLLLRPTPNSGMNIRGVRFANSTTHLWSPLPLPCDVKEVATPPPPATSAARMQPSQQSQLDLQPLEKIESVPFVNRSWHEALQNNNSTNKGPQNQQQQEQEQKPYPQMCEQCMFLPINNGNENEGEALVIDFTSELFEGTLLLRIRNTVSPMPNKTTSSTSTDATPYDDSHGYFFGMNRRYQAIIKGEFLKPIPWTHCLSGMTYDRPFGKLPPKWVVRGGLKVITFFAPQLQCKFYDTTQPSSVTPLGSTPQVIIVDTDSTIDNDTINDERGGGGGGGDKNADNRNAKCYQADASIQSVQEEPIEAERTLLGEASDAPVSLARARFRKKAFDKLYVNFANAAAKVKNSNHRAPSPLLEQQQQDSGPRCADTSKVYTFEFLQHLIQFHDFSVELGSMFGSVPLEEVLDGQPLQIMAAHHEDHHANNDGVVKENMKPLWSFDIWHEKLYAASAEHDGFTQPRR